LLDDLAAISLPRPDASHVQDGPDMCVDAALCYLERKRRLLLLVLLLLLLLLVLLLL
jgi:hypothetical protein